MQLRESDTGRSLRELHINIDCPNLIDLIRKVETQQKSLSQEVKLLATDNYFILQIHPYHLSPNNVQGTVLTFVNIDKLKAAEAKVRAANAQLEERVKERTETLKELNARYELMLEGSDAGIGYWDLETNAGQVSPRFAQILGYDDPHHPHFANFATFHKLFPPTNWQGCKTP